MKTERPFNPKEILDSIELPDNLDRLIGESVEKGYKRMQGKKKNKKAYMVKRAAVIAAVITAGCLAAIPVKAWVSSLVQERMEQVPEEELKEVESVMDGQMTDADSYSREYSQEEKAKYVELRKAYIQGTFPENELRQEKTADAALTDVLYYAQDTSVFYLPDRELTDEELLQIIDFQTKRDYILEQRTSREKEEEHREAREQIAEAGGITEEKAIELGGEWLTRLYGITGEGMELNHYPDTDGDKPKYNVNFSIQSHAYYYFWLDSRNGELVCAMNSMADDLDSEPLTTAVLEEKKEALCRTTEDYLTNQLGKEADYKRVVYSYREKDGRLDNFNQVRFYFIKEDGSAYEVTMNVSREAFSGFQLIDNYEEYVENYGKIREVAGGDGKTAAEPVSQPVYKDMTQ